MLLTLIQNNYILINISYKNYAGTITNSKKKKKKKKKLHGTKVTKTLRSDRLLTAAVHKQYTDGHLGGEGREIKSKANLPMLVVLRLA